MAQEPEEEVEKPEEEEVEKPDEEKVVEEGNWLPLESNPEICNEFGKRMGMGDDATFTDIYGIDEELLGFVPQPVHAVMLLFPSSPGIYKFKVKQQAKIAKNGQKLSDKLFYLHQHDDIGNACGTIACIHALANVGIKLKADGPLAKFIAETKGMDWSDRGWALLKAKDIQEVSEEVAASESNQTRTPKRHEKVEGHFIAFIHKDGNLYELDGCKRFPINHGKTTKQTFLKDCAKVIKECFMDQADGSIAFNMMALSGVQ